MMGQRCFLARLAILVFALGASILVLAQSPARSWFQPWLGIDASMSPAHCAQEPGGRCALVCAASDGLKVNVEGTDVYSNYSSICAAAIHAGVLKPGQAGAVVIVIGPGEKAYKGSVRNGVASRNYGPRASSFTFATDGTPGIINWQTSWSRLPAEFAGPITVTCPAGGDANAKVWGTDVYTVESSICGAAVHAGVITLNGGDVTVKRSPGGLRQYPSSARNGIASRPAGAHTDAFSVDVAHPAPLRAAPHLAGRPVAGQQAVAPGSPFESPASSGAAPGQTLGEAPTHTLGTVVPTSNQVTARTITLTGWTASSTSVPVTPRTIQLAGFTASSTAISVAPRTFTLPGWTAAGLAGQGVIP
jgi:hypothetical protein